MVTWAYGGGGSYVSLIRDKEPIDLSGRRSSSVRTKVICLRHINNKFFVYRVQISYQEVFIV